MLASLRVRSFAIIDELELELRSGLNVLTGETGAGKSILVGALDLLLGGRALADVVRQGAEEATVEGLFRLTDERARQALRDADLADPDDPSVMLVRRVVARSGRNRIHVNGNMATAAMLRDVTRRLVDLSSQHAQYALLDPAGHLEVLDRFGALDAHRATYVAAYADLRRLEAERAELRRAERERLEREDFLRFQHQELADAALVPGEDDSLEGERRRLANAERLRQGATAVLEGLGGGRSNAVASLVEAERALRDLVSVDGTLAPLRSRLESARIEVEDVAFEVRRYVSSVDGDPARLAAIDERLDLIRRIKRKYGASIEEILRRMAEIGAELDRFSTAEERIAELDRQIVASRQRVIALGDALSTARKEAAVRLAHLVEEELRSLAMGRCRVRVAVDPAGASPEASIGPTGLDTVELLVSTNTGEPHKALARSASGGELSRILLALKGVLLGSDPVSTSIFDEVDAGVGGAVAEILGRKLKKASLGRQVLCITHLPQVAAYGDHHLRVEKGEVDGRTVTRVSALDAAGRAEEIARMLGGLTITRRTQEHAHEMLRLAASAEV
ncbi:MAG: DNA repair protein RecN [Myxococcales bacterium]